MKKEASEEDDTEELDTWSDSSDEFCVNLEEELLRNDPWRRFERWKSNKIQQIGLHGKYPWSTFGSTDRVNALALLYPFLDHMLSFASENPNFEKNILNESLNLALEQEIPIPPELYKQILDAITEDDEELRLN